MTSGLRNIYSNKASKDHGLGSLITSNDISSLKFKTQANKSPSISFTFSVKDTL